MALSTEGQVMNRPADTIKDPMAVEFLGLEERSHAGDRPTWLAAIGQERAL